VNEEVNEGANKEIKKEVNQKGKDRTNRILFFMVLHNFVDLPMNSAC
jgi:hypothetical protein